MDENITKQLAPCVRDFKRWTDSLPADGLIASIELTTQLDATTANIRYLLRNFYDSHDLYEDPGKETFKEGESLTSLFPSGQDMGDDDCSLSSCLKDTLLKNTSLAISNL